MNFPISNIVSKKNFVLIVIIYPEVIIVSGLAKNSGNNTIVIVLHE